MDTPRGVFIVLEGIDGCGSTTQAQRLADALIAQGKKVTLTAEPSMGEVGRLIRRALLRAEGTEHFDWATMALLFAADRMHHLRAVIEPALSKGDTVICDRYDLSSLAYQSASAGGTAGVTQWIVALNRFARRPDLTLVFDIDPALAETRRKARGGAEEIFEQSELQRRLAVLYQQAEVLVPGDRVLHVDAAGSPDDVHRWVMAGVLALEAAQEGQ